MTSVCSVPLGIPRQQTTDEPVRQRRNCTRLFYIPPGELDGDMGLVIGHKSWFLDFVRRQTFIYSIRFNNRDRRLVIVGPDMRTCLRAEELFKERVAEVLEKIKRPRLSSVA